MNYFEISFKKFCGPFGTPIKKQVPIAFLDFHLITIYPTFHGLVDEVIIKHNKIIIDLVDLIDFLTHIKKQFYFSNTQM